jgi:hypothetical protein
VSDCTVRSDADVNSGQNGLFLDDKKIQGLLSDLPNNETVPRALAALIYDAKKMKAAGICTRIKIEAFAEDLSRALKFVEAREVRDRAENAFKRLSNWKAKFG